MTYCITDGYIHRENPSYWDDTGFTDEWQREVYLMAAAMMASHNYQSVLDIGCGSGFKLVEYLGQYDTTGIDIEPTLSFLRSKYPKRAWLPPGTYLQNRGKHDLVICADVIEHFEDPNVLCRFVEKSARQHVIFSTPDRGLHGNLGGPPENKCHAREWTFAEFNDYISTYFRVLAHLISNREQTTQTIICELK